MRAIISEYKMWKSSSFLLIFSLIVAKTLLFTVLIPPWQGPDEPLHFKMGYVLAHPVTDIQKLNTDMLKSLQQYRFQKYTDYTQKESVIPELNAEKLPGYYTILAFLFRSFSGLSMIGKMFLGRLFSAACYLGIVLLVYRISRKIFTGVEGYWVPMAAVSFVGFQPQYSFFSITLNSDNLVSLLLTVILFCIVHISSQGQEAAVSWIRKYWPWLIAILAVLVGLLVKRTGFVGFVLFCISIPIVMGRDRRSLIRASSVAMALLALPTFFFLILGLTTSHKLNMSKHPNHTHFIFPGLDGDVRLTYQAFDVDFEREVVILLNGIEIAHVDKTENNKWGPICTLILPDRLVNDNTSNTLTFDNVYNPPHTYSWGVRNVQIGDVLKVEEARGEIPPSKIFEGLKRNEGGIVEEKFMVSIIAKWSARVGQTIRQGIIKLRDMFHIPFYLIVRFILVQFVSFWFSLGWMIYKMSLGWYVFFGLITLLSLFGMTRLIYTRFRNRKFEFINMKVVSLLLLLFALSQVAMVIAYGPSLTSSINDAMGRCRFMEIGALSVLIPLGLWAISPARKRDIVMKFFVCFMIFLNMVSVFKYIIPIFYL